MAVPAASVDLGPGVGAWFTGRDTASPPPALGQAGNLAHRRPHVPAVLAADRAALAEVAGVAALHWHLMRQAHGAEVAEVDEATPGGQELRDVDAAFTRLPGRALVVQAADCVPLLVAGDDVVGVAHAGREGVRAGVVGALLAALERAGVSSTTLRAAIGPAIGGCCYELPEALRAPVADAEPLAATTTTWGTPSLDLPATVQAVLERAGVAVVRAGGCTRCDPQGRWFSHRADPDAGRQVGLVVLHETGRRETRSHETGSHERGSP